MSKIKNYPKVIIVGRTNVGKSTIFNRLASSQQSIVFSREGVTRDYVHEVIPWNNKTFDLIDTGGLPLTTPKESIDQHVKDSVLALVEKADLILFVCDIKAGLTELDQKFAKHLHKTKKPIFLLLNKSDNLTAAQENEHEFFQLGLKKIFPISAIHNTGIRELLDAIAKQVESVKKLPEKPEYKVVILGKPNVGKSSLLNLLLKEQRAIVSHIAGTTREAISELLSFQHQTIQLTDTAGVRRKGKVGDPLELFMVKSSLEAVRTSDIVIVIIDSTYGELADQELKLLFYAFEKKKSVILLLNKTDILEEHKKAALEYDLEHYDFFLKKIPILRTSCKTEKNVGKVMQEVEKAYKRRTQTFDEEQVNEILKLAVIKRPMYHKTLLLKVLHIKATKGPIPTFIVYVNYPQWFGPTQLGYLENVLRRNFDLLGCPVLLIPRSV